MSRINRKTWKMDDFGHANSAGIFGQMDVTVKDTFRITDSEYDYLCGVCTDEELELLLLSKPNFTTKRKMIELLNKYIKY